MERLKEIELSGLPSQNTVQQGGMIALQGLPEKLESPVEDIRHLHSMRKTMCGHLPSRDPHD